MKSAIVVGATSGIGRGLSELLVNNNFKVGITGRRRDLLAEMRNGHTDDYFIKSFDVTETATVQQHLDELLIDLGYLDLLIICAGTGELNESLKVEIEKKTIDTNVIGFTAVACWAFNYFEKQGIGHIVAITSIAGLRGSRAAPSYNASKAYQINYLEGLRQKAVKLNLPITITDVRPGYVDTDMAKGDAKFWVASVDKASKQIFKAILQKRSLVYVTRRWKLFAVVFRFLPALIYNRL